MQILIVHPVMTFLGGGERLCCDTIRALKSDGHELTILSSNFEPQRVEKFFGYEQLFNSVDLMLYKSSDKTDELGTPSHLFRHLRGQQRALNQMKKLYRPKYDLMFSTQDPGYLPSLHLKAVQWGYFQKTFSFPKSPPNTI